MCSHGCPLGHYSLRRVMPIIMVILESSICDLILHSVMTPSQGTSNSRMENPRTRATVQGLTVMADTPTGLAHQKRVV